MTLPYRRGRACPSVPFFGAASLRHFPFSRESADMLWPLFSPRWSRSPSLRRSPRSQSRRVLYRLGCESRGDPESRREASVFGCRSASFGRSLPRSIHRPRPLPCVGCAAWSCSFFVRAASACRYMGSVSLVSFYAADIVGQSRAKCPFSLHLKQPQSFPTPVPTASCESRISLRSSCE